MHPLRRPRETRTRTGPTEKGDPIYHATPPQESHPEARLDPWAHVADITIPDVPSAKLSRLIRKMNPAAHIITLTMFVREVEPLYAQVQTSHPEDT
jgi:DNA-binding NarL/FixJ family response regulator